MGTGPVPQLFKPWDQQFPRSLAVFEREGYFAAREWEGERAQKKGRGKEGEGEKGDEERGREGSTGREKDDAPILHTLVAALQSAQFLLQQSQKSVLQRSCVHCLRSPRLEIIQVYSNSLSTLSLISATVAEFRRCLAVFGDSLTFLRQCGQGLSKLAKGQQTERSADLSPAKTLYCIYTR